MFLQQLQLVTLHVGIVNRYLLYSLHAASEGLDVKLTVVVQHGGALGVFLFF